jgi:hypothetical protein
MSPVWRSHAAVPPARRLRAAERHAVLSGAGVGPVHLRLDCAPGGTGAVSDTETPIATDLGPPPRIVVSAEALAAARRAVAAGKV